MACRTEFETEETLRQHLARTNEGDAWESLDDLKTLADGFENKHKATSVRLNGLFDIGLEIYAERFEHDWCPF